jgi:hypothetical protein
VCTWPWFINVKNFVLGHSTEFCYPPWATMQTFIKCNGPQHKIIDRSAESHQLHSKAFYNLERINKAKKMYILKINYSRPISSMLEILPRFLKKLILGCEPLRRMIFKFK